LSIVGRSKPSNNFLPLFSGFISLSYNTSKNFIPIFIENSETLSQMRVQRSDFVLFLQYPEEIFLSFFFPSHFHFNFSQRHILEWECKHSRVFLITQVFAKQKSETFWISIFILSKSGL
jgi:hypothetical protein